MTQRSREFKKGIRLKPNTDSVTLEGEAKYDDTAKKLQYRDDSATRSVVSEDGTQTLENKTIDATSATGNNTISMDSDDVSYDNGASGLTATDVKAAIDELKTGLDNQNEASEITYDNSTSGLTATDVQAAIDEVDSNFETLSDGNIRVGNGSNLTTAVDTASVGDIDADATAGLTIKAGVIVDADINASAAIDATKIGNGDVDNTELSHLNGVTSAIQTQIDGKQADVVTTKADLVVGDASGDASRIGVGTDGQVLVADSAEAQGIKWETLNTSDFNVVSSSGTFSATANATHLVDTSGGVATVTLPAPSANRFVRIKDSLGNANTNNITVNPNGAETIDGTASRVMDSDFEDLLFVSDGTNYFVFSTVGDQPKAESVEYTPQSADPSNPTEGMVFRSDGTSRTKGLYEYKDGQFVAIGSGSGGELNFYEKGDAELGQTSDFTTGNNSSFDGGGTLQGTFSVSTTAADQIRGTKAYKLVLNSTGGNSDDDYVASDAFDIPQGYRGRTLGIKLQYKYDGADGDIKWVVLDDTNTTILTTEVELLDESSGANNIAKELTFSFFCPSNCEQIKIGPQVVTHATGSEELIWDDVIVTPNPFVYKDLTRKQEGRFTDHAGNGSSATAIPYFTTQVENSGDNIVVMDNDSTNGFSVTALQDCIVSLTLTGFASSATVMGASKDAPSLSTNINSVPGANRIAADTADASEHSSISCTVELKKGEVLRPHTQTTSSWSANELFVHVVAHAESEHIVTPLESVNPVRYQKTGTQSISSAALTIVDFDDKTTDLDNLVTTGGSWAYTAASSGVLRVSARIIYDGSSAWTDGELGRLHIYKNGAEYCRLDIEEMSATPSGTYQMDLDGSDLVPVDKDDTIDIRVFQNSGSAINLLGGTTGCYVSIEKVDQNATLGAIPYSEYQIRTLSSDLTSTNSDVSSLRFSNLTIGNHYRVTLQMRVFHATSTGAGTIEVTHNGTVIAYATTNSVSSDASGQASYSVTVPFKAEATTVTFNASAADGSNIILGNGTQEETYSVIEELPLHRETTRFS